MHTMYDPEGLEGVQTTSAHYARPVISRYTMSDERRLRDGERLISARKPRTSQRVGLNSTEIDEAWDYFCRMHHAAGHNLKDSVMGTITHMLLRRGWS